MFCSQKLSNKQLLLNSFGASTSLQRISSASLKFCFKAIVQPLAFLKNCYIGWLRGVLCQQAHGHALLSVWGKSTMLKESYLLRRR